MANVTQVYSKTERNYRLNVSRQNLTYNGILMNNVEVNKHRVISVNMLIVPHIVHV